MKITDKEILDFVRDNLVIDKDDNGNFEIKEVLCSIIGDVNGRVIGAVYGDVNGNVNGTVYGDVYRHVRNDVCGSAKGS